MASGQASSAHGQISQPWPEPQTEDDKEAAMHIQALREYEEFSKHLNFSAAARYLHMSQSGLSKHIAEMECELGFSLVNRDGQPSLTAAGKLFLTAAQEMLYNYDIVVEKCRSLHGEKIDRLVIHDPLIDATIGDQTIPAMMFLYENYPNIDVTLHTIKGQTVTEALLDGTVDVGYYMAYGDIGEIIAERAGRGITARPLRKRGYSVWFSKDSPLAQKESLLAEDLRDTQFLVAADRLFDDWRTVLDKLGRAHGYVPRVRLKVTPTINGFLTMNLSDGAVILSEAFLKDPRFLMRKDMVARQIENDSYTLFYVHLKENTNPALPIFTGELDKQVEEALRAYALT
jgi:DNA-binding transcriptional LysR family regulator